MGSGKWEVGSGKWEVGSEQLEGWVLAMDYDVVFENESWIVRDSQSKYAVDLRQRLFRFAVDTFRFLGTLPRNKEYDVFRYQLSKSSTSIGANYEEAQGGYSRKEFASKVGISFKEAKETNYFYRVIQTLKIGDSDECERLTKESDEIKRILGTIFKKVRAS